MKWLASLVQDLHTLPSIPILHCDNKAAQHIEAARVHNSVDCHYVREKVEEDLLTLANSLCHMLASGHQVADIMAKLLNLLALSSVSSFVPSWDLFMEVQLEGGVKYICQVVNT